jgi:phosphatidylserine/phosphatidylglycerophosphate/cardiolipin synthase-like enzyme
LSKPLELLAATACLIAGMLLFADVATTNAEIIGQWFSPHGGCTAAIVEQCDKARKSIDYQMYSFTSKHIAEALVRAHGRGVKVTLLLDAKSTKQEVSQADDCAKAGLSVFVDAQHAIAHNKTRIFDNKRVMFGSFNDSAGAEERNAEALVLEDDPKVVERFAENFKQHLQHSTRMEIK